MVEILFHLRIWIVYQKYFPNNGKMYIDNIYQIYSQIFLKIYMVKQKRNYIYIYISVDIKHSTNSFLDNDLIFKGIHYFILKMKMILFLKFKRLKG